MPTLHQKHAASARWVALTDAVRRLLNLLGFVAFKMGRLRGGPSRTGVKGANLDRYVTDPAAAGQQPTHFQGNPPGRGRLAVFPPPGGSTVMIQIAALYRRSGSDRLEKQPTDPATAGRSPRDLGDGALAKLFWNSMKSLIVRKISFVNAQ
jgi:hypothetical protein